MALSLESGRQPLAHSLHRHHVRFLSLRSYRTVVCQGFGAIAATTRFVCIASTTSKPHNDSFRPLEQLQPLSPTTHTQSLLLHSVILHIVISPAVSASMKRRPSLSTDDDAESSLESDALDQRVSQKSPAARRPSSSRNTRSGRLNWNHANGTNGYAGSEALKDTTTLPQPSLTTVHSTTHMGKERSPEDSPRPARSLWSISWLTFITALLGIVILASIVGSFVTRPSDAKGCRMSFMRPSYVHFADFDTEHTRFATKYSLYLYREQGVDDDKAVSIYLLLPSATES